MNAKRLIGTTAVALSTFAYAAVYWLGNDNLDQAQMLTSLQFHKPWVYRQLVPLLARAIALLGIRIDLALVLIVTVAGVGFYLALRSFASFLYKLDDKAEILIILLVVLGLLLFGYLRLPYDLMTAWLFALAFRYIALGEDDKLTVVFVLACINRETAFLLLLFMAPITKFRWERFAFTLKLGILFVLIQVAIRLIFQHNAGLPAWVDPIQNIRDFIDNPIRTLWHATVTAVLLWLVYRDWNKKPVYLRLAFVILKPIMAALYLVLGQAFEVRVFWEIYPVLALLMLPTLHSKLVGRKG